MKERWKMQWKSLNKKIRLLLMAAAALVVAVIVLLLSTRADRSLEMPLPYTNESLIYMSTDTAAMQTGNSLAASLCVSDKDVANDKIALTQRNGLYAALFSLDDRKVIYSKGMYDKIYPASITKIMTAILALEHGNMDDVVTINWQDLELETGSQVVGFRIGDKVALSELLRGLLIHSGNDAAQAIARHIAGSQAKFVDMMNSKLQELGCTGSHFMNPSGLHNENHYTTLYDIYLMLNAAVRYPEFVNIMHVSVYDLGYTGADGSEKHVTLDSTDHYLTGEVEAPKNVTVLGGKTGTTSAAGHNLAIESQNAYGQPYISIVVGAKTADLLYENMNVLLSQIN